MKIGVCCYYLFVIFVFLFVCCRCTGDVGIFWSCGIAWWLDKSLKFRVAAQSSNWFPQIKIDKDLMFMKIIMNTILLVSNITISFSIIMIL